MPRTLVVDADPLGRAVLVDLLRALGHQTQAVAGGTEAVLRSTESGYDYVVAATDGPGMSGLELAERLGQLDAAPGVVLVGAESREAVTGEARARGVALLGVLPRPVEAPQLAAVLRGGGRAAVTPSPMDADRGPIERTSPVRVLHHAHRVDAAGALIVEHDGETARVVVRGGRVVHSEGVPGLLAALNPTAVDHKSLQRDLGAAVAAGHPVDRALEAASAALGEWLARASQAHGGSVRFEVGVAPPPGSFPLPTPLPRLLAAGLRAARPAAAVEASWGLLAEARVVARPPDDSSEERWGLDPTALRLLRLAHRPSEVRSLLLTAGGEEPARRAEVLRALDLLHAVGLLQLDAPALARDTTATAPRPAAAATPAPAPPVAAADAPDPRAEVLRVALAALEGAHPVDVLEVGDRKTLTEAEVAQAFRVVSKRFHPDNYFTSPPLVRAMAEACFSRINGAYDAIRAPGGLAETNRFLAARAEGRGFVNERAHQAARVAFRRAEVCFRARDWRGADALFVEAARLDPQTWPHQFYAHRAGALSKRLTVDEAVRQLTDLTCPDVARRAEVLVAMGNLLKMEQRQAEALRCYQQALQTDPQNRDAQREVRLHQARNESTSVTPSTAERLTGFFKKVTERK